MMYVATHTHASHVHLQPLYTLIKNPKAILLDSIIRGMEIKGQTDDGIGRLERRVSIYA